MANVFVSHAGRDIKAAEDIRIWLSKDEGHDVFLDRDFTDGIPIGDDWSERLEERLRWSDAVICLLSAAYGDSAWCTAEVAIAHSRGSRLLPLTLEDGASHPLLDRVQHYPLWSHPDEVREAVGKELFALYGTGRRAWPDDRPAFPGLAPFTVADRRAFFGRDGDIRRLLAGVRSTAQRNTAVTLVVGPSGCGKSSLVMAGLMPAVGGDRAWLTLDAFTPGPDPLSALVDALVRAADRAERRWTSAEVHAQLVAGRLTGLVTDLLVAAEHRQRLLAVVDQFEELVTQADPDRRREFIDAFLGRTARSAVQVVGTLRPEFLDVVQADPAFAGVLPSVELVGPLPPSALPTVIEGPARLAGITIEAGLVEQIVADTGTGDALPLLAFTLAELAKGVQRRGELTHARYDDVKGVQGALFAQAADALTEAAALRGRTEPEVLRELLRLVTVDAQGRPTRLRVPTATLSGDAQAELVPFVERHILVTGGDDAERTISVAHEAVLTAWPPLATAIEAERVALRARDAVEEAARQWAQQGNPAERLWERDQLAIALHDVGAPPRGPVGTERVELSARSTEFLRLSARRDRLRRGRLNLVLTTLLVLALIAAGIAVVSAVQAREASKLNLARQLVARAEALRGGDDRTALRLGIAAQWLRPDPTTAASLTQTLAATRYTRTLPVPSGVGAVAFSRDGQLMATGSAAGQVQLWRTADPLRPTPLGAPLDAGVGTIYSVEFASNSLTLAVAGGTNGAGKAELMDVGNPSAPRQVAVLPGHNDVVHAATFSRDGRMLATVGFDRRMLLWDVGNPGRPVQLAVLPSGHSDKITTAVFSPDGRTLATGGFDKQVLLWDVSQPTQPALIGPVPGAPANAVWTLAWSGPTLAAASADGTVRLWDVGHPRTPTPVGDPIRPGTGQANAVAFAPDGVRLAVASSDRSVTLWDIADRAHPRQTEVLTGHADYVYALAFRDDTTLVSGSADGTAVVWDLTGGPTAAAVEPPPPPDVEVFAAVTTPDGQVLAIGTADGRIALTDVGTGRLLATVGAGLGAVRSLAVTRDGRTLAVAGEAGVGLWDITQPADPRPGPAVGDGAHQAYSVDVSGDGRTLAAGGGNGVVRLWDLDNAARPPVQLKKRDGAIYAVRFGGTRLAAGGADNRIILWDVGQPEQPTPIGDPLGAHAAAVTAIAFSSDGATMAAGGRDGAVRLWQVDAAGARPFGQQPAGRSPSVLTVALGGRTLAAGYADGRVALWDLSEPGYPRPLGPDLIEPSAVHALVFPASPATLVTATSASSVRRWDLAARTALQADPAGQACAAVGAGLDPDQWATFLPTETYTRTCR